MSPYEHRAAQLEKLKAASPAGEHYRKHGTIQPIDLIESFKLPYHEGEIIAKVARWRDKGGVGDLRKARWLLDRLILLAEPEQLPLPFAATTSSMEQRHATEIVPGLRHTPQPTQEDFDSRVTQRAAHNADPNARHGVPAGEGGSFIHRPREPYYSVAPQNTQ